MRLVFALGFALLPVLAGCVTHLEPREMHPEEYLLAMDAPVVKVGAELRRQSGDHVVFLGTGLACEEYVLTAAHACVSRNGTPVDRVFVNGVETRVLERREPRHPYDDLAKLAKPSEVNLNGTCQAYQPSAGDRAWIVGYGASQIEHEATSDDRVKTAIPGIVVDLDLGEGDSDVVVIEFDRTWKFGGFSGGPARVLVDGEMLDFGIVCRKVNHWKYTGFWPFLRLEERNLLAVRLCEYP